MEYFDIYKLRLNRYGSTYQDRIQNKREHEFQLYLAKSIYKVEFTYNNQTVTGSFEKYKQDETETLHYLLTPVDTNIAPGTVLQIPNKDGTNKPWMVYYLEQIKASGYNRYIMLRMTHQLSWTAKDKTAQTAWAYLYGPQHSAVVDSIKSGKTSAVYAENNHSNFFITPKNQYISKDDYFVVGTAPYQEQFRVTGFDLQSTEGVEYVTIDPIYAYDLTPAPTKQTGDTDEEFFWFNGGTT